MRERVDSRSLLGPLRSPHRHVGVCSEVVGLKASICVLELLGTCDCWVVVRTECVV